jgi:hypothetical protein
VLREVALAAVGEHRHDAVGGGGEVAAGDPLGDSVGGDAGRAGTRSDEVAVLAGEALDFGVGLAIADGDELVDHVGVEQFRHAGIVSPDPLGLVVGFFGCVAKQRPERRALGFDGDHADVRHHLADGLCDAHEGAAGADSGDDRADVGPERVEDLLAGRLVVGLDVQGRRELLGDDGVRALGGDFMSALGGPRHARVAGHVDDLGPEGGHEAFLLGAEPARDDEDRVEVELIGGDRHPDAGVARGGFDDGPAGREVAAVEQSRQDVLADAVLDTAAGVERLQFRVDGHRRRCRIECHERGVADSLQQGVARVGRRR